MMKFLVLCMLVIFSKVSIAQFIIPPVIPPANADPTINEIFKKIEDTLRVKQGEIKVEEVKKSQDLAKGFTPRQKDADEEAEHWGMPRMQQKLKEIKTNRISY
ncbi:MAG: hypothetical protein R2807_06370 [Chitinophagales bacterium]